MAALSTASSCLAFHGLISIPPHHASPKCCRSRSLSLGNSHLLSTKSIFRRTNGAGALFPSILRNGGPGISKRRASPMVFAAQSNFLKVIQTVWKVGKDGVEAGTDLVPDTVPRPVARASVTVVALSVALFVLKSFLSTAFFVLATMGVIYFVFIAFNKDDGPKGGGGTTTNPDPDPVHACTPEWQPRRSGCYSSPLIGVISCYRWTALSSIILLFGL